MAAEPKQTIDVDAVSADVSERFDAVKWNSFNSSDMAARNETRTEVLDIRNDLLKVAAVDVARAAQIWDEHVPSYVPRPFEFPTAEPEPLILNTIEPGRRRRRSKAEPFLEASPAVRPDADTRETAKGSAGRAPDPSPDTSKSAAHGDEPTPEDPKTARLNLLLDGLNRQYQRADDKYHFRGKGGAVAFEVQGKKLLTEHETPAVVGSMIDLAEASGWSSLKLTGTDDFRREAWLQASLRNFEVSGYRPDKLDRAKLEEVRAERAAQAPVNTISEQRPPADGRAKQGARFATVVEEGRSEPRIPLTPTQDQFLKVMEATMRHRGDSVEAIAKARELANERLTSDRIYAGKLVDIGTAPYQDKPGQKPSHYLTLQDDKGQTSKVWGVDLPRALEASGAQLGENVVLAFKGRQSVTVDVPVNGPDGTPVQSNKQTVDRNSWEIVRFDRLREEAKASVLKAVERQGEPARLKVFDRNARPPVAREEPRQDRLRSRERNL